ncbi:GGDEF domain-containing protein [Deinococcus malanensis]|uniref:GGDEF domain-containing protein n=1 Tax=Deinococcus malanensis TaxID=1706855 RepID=UPI0036365288
MTADGHTVRTERARNASLRELAATDELTGVHNRRSGRARLAALAERWAETPDQLAVLMLDVDHFKRINDGLGHDHGDEVLMAIARLLREVAGTGDVVRWGGEEFLVVLEGLKPQEARAVGLRILEEVRRTRLHGIPSLSVSGGLASLDEAFDVRDLVRIADQRLYQAKAGGRDQLI